MNPTSENITSVAPLIHDVALSIAQRKSVGSCTSHPIEKHVTYDKLLSSYKVFVAQLDNIEIPNTVQDALKDPKWKKAVDEEVKVLESEGICTLTTLSPGKGSVGRQC